MKLPVVTKIPSDFHSRTTFVLSVTGVLALSPVLLMDILAGKYQLALMVLFLLVASVVNIVLICQNRFSTAYNSYLLAPATILCQLFAIAELGTAGVFWVYPVILAFYAVLPERHAWVANAVLLTGLAPCLISYLDTTETIRAMLTILVVSVFSVAFTRIINSQQQLLAEQLLIDPLTSLYNRSSLDATLSQTIALHERTATNMTLIAIDIDNFKIINDKKGHVVGDQVLTKVGKILSENVRRSDYVFRMGGEEFLILLCGADLTNGRAIAEKLRSLIENCDFYPIDKVTVSLGVAMLDKLETADSWLTRADKLLYKAKESGRNAVVSD